MAISTEVLASYAADAALEVPGVTGLVESRVPPRRAVRVDDARFELHLAVAWGASIPQVARSVQRHVREYLERMAGVAPESVDVVVDEVAAP